MLLDRLKGPGALRISIDYGLLLAEGFARKLVEKALQGFGMEAGFSEVKVTSGFQARPREAAKLGIPVKSLDDYPQTQITMGSLPLEHQLDYMEYLLDLRAMNDDRHFSTNPPRRNDRFHLWTLVTPFHPLVNRPIRIRRERGQIPYQSVD